MDMDLFILLPPELKTFLFWVVLLLGLCFVVLAITIASSKFVEQFIDWIMRGLR